MLLGNKICSSIKIVRINYLRGSNFGSSHFVKNFHKKVLYEECEIKDKPFEIEG